MKRYRVTVDGKTYEVEVEEIGGNVRASVASSMAVPPAPAAAPAAAAPAAARSTQSVPTAPAPVTPTQATQPVMRDGNGEVIKAPLPGVITEYKVKAGDRVKKGQVLLLLEAMKMQNEIMAPRDALVKSIDNSQGANVNTGDPLLTLE
ncbi:MAG TPA: biotin/lipoyl-binding protein [Firmicutes bacterium]|nr:biotin/lipoyl-binding protein [Bacillota bacterium]